MAVGPKHKPKEIKKKTIFDKLAGSAIALLIFIILVIVDVVALIFWISGILSSKIKVENSLEDTSFQLWVGLALFLVVFFAIAWLVQRAAHKRI